MAAPEVELNYEQVEVVQALADARKLVIAGAGQGKTEVVVSRIDNLVQNEGLTASEEILVLSFSRAAVAAVRNRLNLRDVAAANVRTFDSFASVLLLDAGIQPEGGFEARIRRATQLLREANNIPYNVEVLRHIVIDEIQDLVGDRADFVIAILQRLHSDAGITALGDPLQAVYDFTLEPSQSKTSSEVVFAALSRTFGCELTGLGKNYRARGALPKRVAALGDVLRKRRDGAAAETLLDDLILDLPDRGEIKDWYDLVTPPDGKRTAVLCTTNADVLRVSRYLTDRSIAHAVRRQAQEFGAARWIAGALGELPGPKERRSVVEASLAAHLGEGDVDLRWNELKSAEGRTREFDSLDLIRLNRLVSAGALPLPLTEPDLSSVIVSTIHRAKGLEFDSVFVVEPTWSPDEEDPWTRVRRDYVALSRARDSVYKCRLPKPKSKIGPDHAMSKRFKEEAWSKRGKGRTWTRSIEFQYNDIHTDSPASSHRVNATTVQTNLASIPRVGGEVRLELDAVRSTRFSPSYLLVAHEGRQIGRTSAGFDDVFKKVFGWLDNWPLIVEGLTLVSIETVAGDHRQSENVGLGGSGFWLVPRLTGLACPDLSTTKR